MSGNIENYLGFPSGLTGNSLARRAVAQAVRFGVEILTPQEVVDIRIEGPYRIVKLNDGTEISLPCPPSCLWSIISQVGRYQGNR